MAVVLGNRAKMSTSTTGTGTITLGSALSGYQTFAQAGITNGQTVRYAIEDGTNFEIGSGVFTSSGTTLTRSVTESSNSDNAISLSGSAEVFITASAADIFVNDGATSLTTTGTITAGGNVAISTGVIDLKNGGSQSVVKFYCESSNLHYAQIQAPAHGSFSGNVTLTLPATTDTIAGIAATQTFTNKTLTSPVLNTGSVGTSLAFPDNAKALFGAGSDLQIYHDGSNSIIRDAGAGNLRIWAENFSLQKSDGSESMIYATPDGSVILYYDGNTKFFTTNSGVSVTGNVISTGTVEPAGDTAAGDNAAIGYTAAEGLILTGQGSTSDITLKNDADATVFTVPTGTDDILFPDNAKILMGAESDLQIYHNATHSYIDNNTGNIYIRSNVDDDDGGNIVLEAKAGENGIIIADDGDVSLHFNGNLKLATTNTGVAITGDVVASGTVEPAGDTAAGDNAAVGYTAAEGLILTGQGSTSDITFKNDADAVVFSIPTGTDDILFPDNAKILMGAGSDLQIYHNGSNSIVADVGTGNLSLQSSGAEVLVWDSANGQHMAQFKTGAEVSLRHNGSIKLATTATGATITGAVKPTTYQETYVASSAASTVTLDLATGTSFSLTMDQATTFAFSNPPGSGTAFSFTLFLTQHSSAVAITWPNTVDWAGGSAPDAAGANELQAYAFFTRDGGTTYYGFLGGTAIA